MAESQQTPDDDDICEVTHKRHIPDWNSVLVEHDGDATYIDVCCKDCGRAGCVGTQKTLEETIAW